MAQTGIAVSIIVYLLGMVAIGIDSGNKNESSAESFYLGGRGLGPWVAAMSAEASDMSSYLLMGLPWSCLHIRFGRCYLDRHRSRCRHILKLAFGGKEIEKILNKT